VCAWLERADQLAEQRYKLLLLAGGERREQLLFIGEVIDDRTIDQ
jgi:hypothetical protein